MISTFTEKLRGREFWSKRVISKPGMVLIATVLFDLPFKDSIMTILYAKKINLSTPKAIKNNFFLIFLSFGRPERKTEYL